MFRELLRSPLVSRHRQIRNEPWKARASESKGTVQARTVGITTSGADRMGPTRHRPVATAWKGSSLVLKPKCLHTYALLWIPRSYPSHLNGLLKTCSECFIRFSE